MTEFADKPGDHIVLDNDQAAALFRLHVNAALEGCQFEMGRMRWWLRQGLRIELVPDGPGMGQWRLYVVPVRSCKERAS
jgi:hypothetical protein